jgi:hypothetical protein
MYSPSTTTSEKEKRAGEELATLVITKEAEFERF